MRDKIISNKMKMSKGVQSTAIQQVDRICNKTNNAFKQTIKNINKQLAKNIQHSLQTKNLCDSKHTSSN